MPAYFDATMITGIERSACPFAPLAPDDIRHCHWRRHGQLRQRQNLPRQQRSNAVEGRKARTPEHEFASISRGFSCHYCREDTSYEAGQAIPRPGFLYILTTADGCVSKGQALRSLPIFLSVQQKFILLRHTRS